MKPAFAARLPAATAVVSIHLLLLMPFLGRNVRTQPVEALPIRIVMVESAVKPADETPAPLPAIPAIAVVVEPPNLFIDVEKESAQEPSAADRVAIENTTPEAPETLIEARFDADYLDNPQPVYPSISRRLQEQGVVVLRVRVSATGAGEIVELYRSSGSRRLDEAALAAVRHWRFVPAKRAGSAVTSWVLVPVEFKLQV